MHLKHLFFSMLVFAGCAAYGEEQARSVRFSGVPDSLVGTYINDERDLSGYISRAHPNFRFYNSEIRGNRTVFEYRQIIHGALSDRAIEIEVDSETRQIIRLRGSELNDIDSIPSEHALSKKEATKAVIEFLESGGELKAAAMQDPNIDYNPKGKHEAELVIRYNVLYWRIGIELNAPVNVGAAMLWHEYFLVDQSGNVTSALQIRTTEIDVIVCEGTGSCKNLVLTDLVIDASGVCQSGYNCSGSTNKYQVPWDTVHAVEDMWEDLLNDVGCCDVGRVNVLNGEIAEVNVGGDTGGASGTYTTGDILNLPNTQYGYITLDDTISGTVPEATAHEMGHAHHALESFSTLGVSDSVSGTTAEKREYGAVVEALADINSVIYQNYQGNETFDDPPDWDPTSTASSYATEFGYDDISRNNDDYNNGRVGGHAFYEFVQAIDDFATAAKVFVKSFKYLEDNDDNYRLSFAEMRQAQIDAAVVLGLRTNEKNALKNAWESVGVGGGAVPNTPPSISLNGKGCSGGYGYYVHFGEVPNANEYEIWENDGGGWDEVDTTTSSPGDVTSTNDANVAVKACNNLGCSALSSLEWFDFQCTI